MSLPRIDQILGNASAVTNIVGTKIYRTQAPENATVPPVPPYIVWSIVSASPENNLASAPEVDESRMQVDCYVPQDSQPQGKTLCNAAVAALEAYYHVIYGPIESKEDDTKYWRWMIHLTTFTDR